MADRNARRPVHRKGIGQPRAITVLADVKNKDKDGDIFLMKNVDIVFPTTEIDKPTPAVAVLLRDAAASRRPSPPACLSQPPAVSMR